MKPPKTGLRDVLLKVPLFDGVSETAMDVLERSSSIRRAERNLCLFFKGDAAEDFILLLTGEVVIKLTSPDGRELIINEIRAGDFIGELGLLTGQPRSADAMVSKTADLLSIPRQAFLTALECEPKLARRLLEAIAIRLSRTSEFQNSLAFLDAQSRLARILLELDRQNEERGYITISQEEIAQRSGLIRQTVAKTLGQWRRQGWLLTGRGHIMLLNRDALRLWLKERVG